MELAVQGSVAMRNGKAALQLTPVMQHHGGAQPQAPPAPEPHMVSSWTIHPSRKPITRQTLTQAIVTVQKQMGLTPGIREGTWSDNAMQCLQAHLANPSEASPETKQKTRRRRSGLASRTKRSSSLLKISREKSARPRHRRPRLLLSRLAGLRSPRLPVGLLRRRQRHRLLLQALRRAA